MQFGLQKYLQVSRVISFFRQVSKKENDISRRCLRRCLRRCRPRAYFYQVDPRLSFDPNKILLFDL